MPRACRYIDEKESRWSTGATLKVLRGSISSINDFQVHIPINQATAVSWQGFTTLNGIFRQKDDRWF